MATTTTRLSTKGQLILPKAIREALPKKRLFPPTKLEDVAGILRYKGKPKTIREMDEGILAEVKRRHALGRY